MLPTDAFLTEITLKVNKKKKEKEQCFLLPFVHPAAWNVGMKAVDRKKPRENCRAKGARKPDDFMDSLGALDCLPLLGPQASLKGKRNRFLSWLSHYCFGFSVTRPGLTVPNTEENEGTGRRAGEACTEEKLAVDVSGWQVVSLTANGLSLGGIPDCKKQDHMGNRPHRLSADYTLGIPSPHLELSLYHYRH